MRKLFSVLTAAVLCAALLAGCGGSNNDTAGKDTAGADQGTAATAAPDAAGNDTMTGEPTPTPGAGGGDTGMAGNSGTGDGTVDGGEKAGGEAAGTAYSAAGLNKVLGGILTVEGGAAGGSLQTAQAAGALVEFAAACGADSATLGADTQAWLESLSEADRAMLKENWTAVRDRARSIDEDPDGNKGVLADAGITTDFSALDMSGVDAFLNTVDSVLGI